MADFITYNGSWVSYNGAVLTTTQTDPNPLGLPAYTIRFQFGNASFDPSVTYPVPSWATWARVSSSPNVWDFTYPISDWTNLFWHEVGPFTSSTSGSTSVLGANTSNVTNMRSMFYTCSALSSVALFDTSSVTDMGGLFCGTAITTVPLFDTSSVEYMNSMFEGCTSLTTVPLFDTSSVLNTESMFKNCSALTTAPLFDTSSVIRMNSMFDGCSSLTEVPLFDTSSVTQMDSTFYECRAVTGGALALYQQASTQATVPSSHTYAFRNCGADTVTGAAELAQIPSGWK